MHTQAHALGNGVGVARRKILSGRKTILRGTGPVSEGVSIGLDWIGFDPVRSVGRLDQIRSDQIGLDSIVKYRPPVVDGLACLLKQLIRLEPGTANFIAFE